VFRFRDKTVQIGGSFAGSLQLEGSLGGEEFVAIGVPVTAAALVAVPLAVEFLRVRLLALTSGRPTATFAGFDYRAA
jgi:hypothetical protein